MTPADLDAMMARWVGRTLRVGIALSGALLAIGVLMSVFLPGSERASHAIDPRQWWGRPVGELIGSPAVISMVGILFLMLTPVGRVVMTMVFFLRERDWRYVGISLVVLAILTGSIVVAFLS